MQSPVIDCDRYTSLWVSWKDGYISAGVGDLALVDEIIYWKDSNPSPVNGVFVSSGIGSDGQWEFATTAGEIIVLHAYFINPLALRAAKTGLTILLIFSSQKRFYQKYLKEKCL